MLTYCSYERYLNIDDDAIFGHLESLNLQVKRYTGFVRRLLRYQLQGLFPTTKIRACHICSHYTVDDSSLSSYYNLAADYADCLPDEDYVMLLLDALGGSNVPEALLKDCRLEQRRWNALGEIRKVTAADFGLPAELIGILSDDDILLKATQTPYILKSVLADGSATWSLSSDATTRLSKGLQTQTLNELGTLALKIICFTCPPCFEGNTSW